MSDEKRIKDFEPATELLNDDWFAVDSPSQGTRKMQASMFQAGLQSQITANRDDIDLHSGQIATLQLGVANIGDKVDILDSAVTTDAYSALSTYAVGDYCIYEDVMYKCTTAIATPEAFNPSHWSATSIENEINELNSSLSKLGIFENGGFSSITVSPGTWVKCKEYTLNNPGVYILNSIVSFVDHNTSIYTHRVSVGSNNYNIRNNASNGGGSNLSLIISISTPTTIQLYVNATFATTANGNLQCVRLT